MSADETMLDDVKKTVFAGYLARGLTVIKAAQEMGVHPATGYRWRDDPDVTTELQRLRAETRPRLVRALTDLGDTAVGIYRAAMDLNRANPVPPVAFAAAKDTLEKLGLTKKELADYLGHPDDQVTIVVPLAVVGDPRAEQEQRRAEREARQAQPHRLMPPSQRYADDAS